MKRIDFEEKSRSIINGYISMLDAMNKSYVTDNLCDDTSASSYGYLKLTEISKLWEVREKPLWDILSEIFVSLHALNIPVSVVLNCDGSRIGFFVGGPLQYIEIIKNTYIGTASHIHFAYNEHETEDIIVAPEVLNAALWTDGGFIKGNPTGTEDFAFSNQIEKVIRGMKGKKWQVSIFASPIKKADSVTRQHAWLTLFTDCSQLDDVTFTDNDNVETTSYKKRYFHSEQYKNKIQGFVERLDESIAMGEWCTTVNFAATNEEDSKLLGGLLASAYFGERSSPEPIHAIFHPERSFRRLVNGMSYCHNTFCGYPYPLYSCFLSSKELSVFAAPPTADTAGISVIDHVDFDANRKVSGDVSIGCILENGKVTKNSYLINANEFNRHCLVVGLTGSGKTNTVKSLVCSLTHGSSRPVMIIEPAKKEYWELYRLGFDDLQIYSVGASGGYAHRLCINPFERAVFTDESGIKRSVPIQTHIDFVYAAFKASFIMYTPMPYVLERAIYSIYEDCGWDIHNNVNVTGEEIYPTIEDLYYKIPDVVTEMGYDQKMRNDLIGSLQARINSMRLGTKGDTLNVRHSFPMDRLLSGNVVIELEDIGDDDVKAFIISLILVSLLEYRRQQEDCQQSVRHLMFIEEAHRLLKNVQSGTGENADPRGAAVEFFCNLLAELRSKGQGFIVADQIPSKLAPDLIKNTNLKIVHRTVAAEERELVGGAMHMTPEQIDSLSSLEQGVAAVYSEGDNRPKLVKSPYAKQFIIAERASTSREGVLAAVANNVISAEGKEEYASLTNVHSDVCRHCQKKNRHQCCKKSGDALRYLRDIGAFYEKFEPINPRKSSCTPRQLHDTLMEYIQQNKEYIPTPDKTQYCLLQEIMRHWGASKSLEKQILDAYLKNY